MILMIAQTRTLTYETSQELIVCLCAVTISVLKNFVVSRPIPMCNSNVCVVVNFLFQLTFTFSLLLGMVMYENEFKTKGK